MVRIHAFLVFATVSCAGSESPRSSPPGADITSPGLADLGAAEPAAVDGGGVAEGAADVLGQDANESGPPLPAPVLWLEPHDGMTNTGESPIRAVLAVYGMPVEQSLLDEISGSLLLTTLDGQVVAVDVTTFSPSGAIRGSGEMDTNASAYVQLTPKSPLSSSWHVLSLSKIPKGVTVAPWSAPIPPQGVYASRFHPESNPAITQVLLCTKGTVVVEFSEGVQYEQLARGLSITDMSSNANCELKLSKPTQAPVVASASFGCVVTDAHFRVTISEGIKSPSGVPLRTPAGEVSGGFDLNVALLPLAFGEPSCWEWRP